MLIELNRFLTTEEVRREYRVPDALADNIPIGAFAFVNGKSVGEDFQLRANDDLMFSLMEGVKGANDKPNGSGFERIKTPFPYIGGNRMPSSWSVFDWKASGSRTGHKERIWFSPHCLK